MCHQPAAARKCEQAVHKVTNAATARLPAVSAIEKRPVLIHKNDWQSGKTCRQPAKERIAASRNFQLQKSPG
jgi:hypothetical protein